MTRRAPLVAALGLLTLVRLLVNTGQRFVYPFLPAIARGLGVSLEQAGLLVSARWAAGLATPAAVRLAGRGGRARRVTAAGMVLFATGAAVTAATNVYAGALAGFVLMGVAKPLYDVSAQAYIADRTPYARRARYLGVLELTWAGGLLVGAPIAGWLIDDLGWAAPFWFLGGLVALSLAMVPWALEPAAPDPGSSTAVRLRPDARTAPLLVVVVLFTIAAEIMFVVLGAWLESAFGLSLLALGGAATVIGLSELAGEGSTLAFADRIGKRRSVAIGLAVSIAGFAGLSAEPEALWLGMVLVAVAFAGFEFTIVSAIPLASEVVPGARVHYLAWMTVAMGVARSVAAAVGPIIFEAVGLAGNAAVAVVADIGALVVLLRWVRDER